MAIKVKLRNKAISGERVSLYLDFYPPVPHPETGKSTRRQFLNLFLFNEFQVEEQKDLGDNGKEQKRYVEVLDRKGNPKKKKLNLIDKTHNINTLKIAEHIRQKRENELNKPEIYTDFEKEQLRLKELGERNFVLYYKSLAEKRKSSTHDNWLAAYYYLESYTGGSIKFVDVSEKWCNDFRDYLLTTKSNRSNKTTLSRNSAVSYFNKVKAALKQAFKDGIMQIDLSGKVESIKESETRRNFLTLEELNSLIRTQCQNPLLKRAALFSALTGLRHSDIKKLKWSEVERINGQGCFINFIQQKTRGVEVHPISEQAYKLMGEPGQPDQYVFDGLDYSAYHNKHLYQWIGAAGITKDITFHCFRHTFATLQLANGTDIYTVSKMLGHSDLKTTQRYAKIVDQMKREAADRIKLDF
jgi:integrase